MRLLASGVAGNPKQPNRSLMRSLGLFVGHIAKAVRHDPEQDRDKVSGDGQAQDHQTVERIETPPADGKPGKAILRRTTTTTNTTTSTTIEEVEVDRPEP